jgi:hypothetical protein
MVTAGFLIDEQELFKPLNVKSDPEYDPDYQAPELKNLTGSDLISKQKADIFL